MLSQFHSQRYVWCVDRCCSKLALTSVHTCVCRMLDLFPVHGSPMQRTCMSCCNNQQCLCTATPEFNAKSVRIRTRRLAQNGNGKQPVHSLLHAAEMYPSPSHHPASQLSLANGFYGLMLPKCRSEVRVRRAGEKSVSCAAEWTTTP